MRMKCLLVFMLLISEASIYAGGTDSESVDVLVNLRRDLKSQEELVLSIRRRNSFLLKGIEYNEERKRVLGDEILEASRKSYPQTQKLADMESKNLILKTRVTILSKLLKTNPSKGRGMTDLELLRSTHTIPDLRVELEIGRRELVEARTVGLVIDGHIHTHRNPLPTRNSNSTTKPKDEAKKPKTSPKRDKK